MICSVCTGHIECVHLLEGHSVDDDDSSNSDDDHTHSDSQTNEEGERADPHHEHEMSMAEAFVSMYSDSTSDTEFDDDDLTSVTQISFSSDYTYTPSPPRQHLLNQTWSPSRYLLTRQKLVYSPPKGASEASEELNNKDDSVLYATAIEESFVMDKSTTVVKGRATAVVGGESKSMSEVDSSLNGTYTVDGCEKQEKQVDLLCDGFSNLTTSTSQSRQTSSVASPTPPSTTHQSRQTGSSSLVASTHQSGQTSSTPSPLDCSFAADIRVQIPDKLRSLTESELRERLVSLGERPGPITPSTKVAYLAYLAKLEAGVQPAGNKGYKGEKDGRREREMLLSTTIQ